MYKTKQQKNSDTRYPVSNLSRGGFTPHSTSRRFALLRNNGKLSAGFTLVELIVTVSIFALISSVVLVRNSQFDNEVLLADVAYDVALSIRQAQNYGINVLGQANEFDHPYGVYFESGEDATTYVLFQDMDGNYTYDSGADLDLGGIDETLETYTLGRNFTVGRLCDLTNSETCTEPITTATIIFLRPNPDAVINANRRGEGALGGVGIELVTPRGGSRFIVVRSTGQISVTQLAQEGPQQ